VSDHRIRYGEQQAAFLTALRTGESPPPGFAAEDLAAASHSLVHKRARQVQESWPALVHALGQDYARAFERFARTTPPPVEGEGAADGFAFACGLDPSTLTDEARAEVLLARAVFTLDDSGVRFRRRPLLAATRLDEPRRLLISMRLPLAGRRHLSIRLQR
jgi:hypothetical protein